jgi:hypothetical protein
MRRVWLVVLSGGCALPAQGQVNARLDWQVSLDNSSWTTSLVAIPGSTVFARGRLSYTGTAAPIGLASWTFQPIVSNWDSAGTADILLPFVNGGAGGNGSSPPGVVTDTTDPTQFGRVAPFGRLLYTTINFIRGHFHTSNFGGAPAGSWLRIAQSQVTSWLGQQGNTTGGGGVVVSQLSNVGRTSADPAFQPGTQSVEVFKFGFVVGDQAARLMRVDVAVAGFGDEPSGKVAARWYLNLNETSGSEQGEVLLTGAVIEVVPAPGAAILLLAAPIVARRRRA